MAHSMFKELPCYEKLLVAAERYPDLVPESCELFLSLLQTGDAVAEVEERYLSRHGITPGRLSVMILLGMDAHVSRKPSELAEMAGVTRATMTGLLDTLERDGLVRREVDGEDRRVTRVEATAACRTLLQKLLPGYFRLISAVSATLTEQDRTRFTMLLKKIREGLVLAEAKFLPTVSSGRNLKSKRNGTRHA